MQLYISWSSVPELADLSKRRRKEAWRYAFPRVLFRPLSLLLLLGLGVTVPAVTDLVTATTESHWWGAIVGLPLAGTLGLLYGSFLMHQARPHFRRFLSNTPEEPAA